MTFIRSSIAEFGTIQRSRTFIGSPAGSVDKLRRWFALQASEYRELSNQFENKREEIAKRIRRAENDHREELKQNIVAIFLSVIQTVSSFAEKYWDKGEKDMTSGWNDHLKNLRFEGRLDSAIQNASLHFHNDVKEAISELGNELRLVSQLQVENFAFSSQDASVFDRSFVRSTGVVMMAAGTLLALVFPPLGFLGVAGTLVSGLASFFKTREQKRSEAVCNIRDSLNRQLVEHRKNVECRALENFDTYARSVTKAIDRHFEELIYGIATMAERLESTEKELAGAADYLNRAYAKRIVDWATDKREILSDAAINNVIHRVERSFGEKIVIETTSALSLTKSLEDICSTLQENTIILPILPD